LGRDGGILPSRRRRVPNRLLLTLLGAALVVGLVQAYRISRGVTRASVPEGMLSAFDLPYRSDTGSHKTAVDIVYHKQNPPGGRPAILFVHGGGWRSGDRRFYRPALIEWAELGYVAPTVNYRLTSQATFPGAIEDVKTSIRWLRAHAEEYGVDPNRIGAMGVSAGAHLVALAAFAQPGDGLDDAGPYQEESSALACIVARSGVYDLRPEVLGATGSGDLAIVHLLGDRADKVPELARKASPVAFLDPDDPPVLIIHGTDDQRVPFASAERLVSECERVGARYEFLPLQGGGHGGARNPEDEGKVNAAMRAFFAKHLGPVEP
jgi:acetyl esterase/lipase